MAVVRDHLQHARASTFLMGTRDQPGLLAVIFREVRNYLRRFTLIRIMLAVLAIDPQARTRHPRPALRCTFLAASPAGSGGTGARVHVSALQKAAACSVECQAITLYGMLGCHCPGGRCGDATCVPRASLGE